MERSAGGREAAGGAAGHTGPEVGMLLEDGSFDSSTVIVRPTNSVSLWDGGGGGGGREGGEGSGARKRRRESGKGVYLSTCACGGQRWRIKRVWEKGERERERKGRGKRG